MNSRNTPAGTLLLATTSAAVMNSSTHAETKVTLNDFYRPFELSEITPKNMQSWPYYRHTSMS